MTGLTPPASSASSPVPALLHRLTSDPGRPRLTWYGPDGERVELSGHVLDNWVTKTANLLVEEMDATPGTHVVLDLPAHWRTVVWALATWRTGACVVLPRTPGEPDGDAASVVVTTRPTAWAGSPGDPEVVAVELAALARSFAGELPAGAIDAAGAVMTYGDVLGPVAPTPATAPALAVGPRVVTHGGLARWAADDGPARPTDDAGSPPRVLLEPEDVPRLLAAALTVLGADGSLVLVDPGAGVDRAHVGTTERVTAGL